MELLLLSKLSAKYILAYSIGLIFLRIKSWVQWAFDYLAQGHRAGDRGKTHYNSKTSSLASLPFDPSNQISAGNALDVQPLWFSLNPCKKYSKLYRFTWKKVKC